MTTSFKQEELATVGDVPKVCSQILLTCPDSARIGRPDTLWSVNKLAKQSRDGREPVTNCLVGSNFVHPLHEQIQGMLSRG